SFIFKKGGGLSSRAPQARGICFFGLPCARGAKSRSFAARDAGEPKKAGPSPPSGAQDDMRARLFVKKRGGKAASAGARVWQGGKGYGPVAAQTPASSRSAHPRGSSWPSWLPAAPQGQARYSPR